MSTDNSTSIDSIISTLTSTCHLLSSHQNPSSLEPEYLSILSTFRSHKKHPKIKHLASDYITKFFHFFPSSLPKTLEALIDLVEDENKDVRIRSIVTLPKLCKQQENYAYQVGNILGQLLLGCEDYKEQMEVENNLCSLLRIDLNGCIESLFDLMGGCFEDGEEEEDEEDKKNLLHKTILFISKRIMEDKESYPMWGLNVERMMKKKILPLLERCDVYSFTHLLFVLKKMTINSNKTRMVKLFGEVIQWAKLNQLNNNKSNIFLPVKKEEKINISIDDKNKTVDNKDDTKEEAVVENKQKEEGKQQKEEAETKEEESGNTTGFDVNNPKMIEKLDKLLVSMRFLGLPLFKIGEIENKSFLSFLVSEVFPDIDGIPKALSNDVLRSMASIGHYVDKETGRQLVEDVYKLLCDKMSGKVPNKNKKDDSINADEQDIDYESIESLLIIFNQFASTIPKKVYGICGLRTKNNFEVSEEEEEKIQQRKKVLVETTKSCLNKGKEYLKRFDIYADKVNLREETQNERVQRFKTRRTITNVILLTDNLLLNPPVFQTTGIQYSWTKPKNQRDYHRNRGNQNRGYYRNERYNNSGYDRRGSGGYKNNYQNRGGYDNRNRNNRGSGGYNNNNYNNRRSSGYNNRDNRGGGSYNDRDDNRGGGNNRNDNYNRGGGDNFRRDSNRNNDNYNRSSNRGGDNYNRGSGGGGGYDNRGVYNDNRRSDNYNSRDRGDIRQDNRDNRGGYNDNRGSGDNYRENRKRSAEREPYNDFEPHQKKRRTNDYQSSNSYNSSPPRDNNNQQYDRNYRQNDNMSGRNDGRYDQQRQPQQQYRDERNYSNNYNSGGGGNQYRSDDNYQSRGNDQGGYSNSRVYSNDQYQQQQTSRSGYDNRDQPRRQPSPYDNSRRSNVDYGRNDYQNPPRYQQQDQQQNRSYNQNQNYSNDQRRDNYGSSDNYGGRRY